MTEFQTAIAKRLSAFAVENRLTQRQLADLLEKDVGYVNKILRGEINLTLRTIDEFQVRLKIKLLGLPRWEGPVNSAKSSINKAGQIDPLSVLIA